MISLTEMAVGPCSLYVGLFMNIKMLVRDHREDNKSCTLVLYNNVHTDPKAFHSD